MCDKDSRTPWRSTPTVMRPTPVQVSSQRCSSRSSGSVGGRRRKASAAQRLRRRTPSIAVITEGEWRATFVENEKWAPRGFGVAPTPWGAVQRAAWEAVISFNFRLDWGLPPH
jgi:hypothetical protein